MNWDSVIEHTLAAIPGTLVAWGAWRSSRQTHTIVNSQRDVMIAEIAALKAEIYDLKDALKSVGE